MPKLKPYLDDLLLVAGCVCILIGVAQLSPAGAWICGGLMLTGFAYLIARNYAPTETGQ